MVLRRALESRTEAKDFDRLMNDIGTQVAVHYMDGDIKAALQLPLTPDPETPDEPYKTTILRRWNCAEVQGKLKKLAKKGRTANTSFEKQVHELLTQVQPQVKPPMAWSEYLKSSWTMYVLAAGTGYVLGHWVRG